MNLFCFTLEGSTESVYEPAYSHALKEVVPKYQCSPALLRSKAEWGGSNPSITSSPVKLKKDNRRSCLPASSFSYETSERGINHSCWDSPGDNSDLFYLKTIQDKGVCEAPCQSGVLTREDRLREPSCDRTHPHLPTQSGETPAATAGSIQSTGRLKRLQHLVHTKRGHQSGAGRGKSTSDSDHSPDAVRSDNPVLTCIGLGRRAEKKPVKSTPPQEEQHTRGVHPDPEEEVVWRPRVGTNHPWSPFGCPQLWSPLHHTCHPPGHELWACSGYGGGGGTLSLPRTTEWDRFESLIQELDNKQTPPQMIRSITDLHLCQNKLSRFGRGDAFRQPSPEKTSVLQKQEQRGELMTSRVQWKNEEEEAEEVEGASSPSDSEKHADASPQKPPTALNGRDVQADEAQKIEADHGRSFSKGRRRSSNSLESLYSLNSGQSSSSGVTSGSNCSSNRNSLRLEDDLLSARQFCGRARVHTEYVPSPYDTESLKLKVGDVIDIIAKPPMGIWRGLLRGKTGSFKFIYVDVLKEESHKGRHKSTVQEVLKRLSLEEYSSALQLSGYQTVDDLKRLREHHLTKLNVTDPEHRQRLLTAVHSLQQLHSECQSENEADWVASENTKANMNNCPRDSGCHMQSDSLSEEAEAPSQADVTAAHG